MIAAKLILQKQLRSKALWETYYKGPLHKQLILQGNNEKICKYG